MVESMASTSLLGHRPICGGNSAGEASNKCKSRSNTRFLTSKFAGKRLVMSNPPFRRLEIGRFWPIKALAMEVAKEAYSFKEERIPRDWDYQIEGKPGLWPPENRADNPSLQNPLLRQERMGSGWLGAIFEWEGVLAEDNPELENQAWLLLAEEEGRPPPPAFVLRRAEGMKSEQAVSEVLCWSRDPAQTRRIAGRKEAIRAALQGGAHRLRPGSREFVRVLTRHGIPMALVSTRPRAALESAVGTAGIGGSFGAVVAAEDVHRGKPDPEMFVHAAQLLKFIPERCIVFGNSNQTVEAAHDARMKCVGVASKHPVYELGAADLVVRRLDELSVVDLKNLAAVESPEFEPEMEMELEEEEGFPSPATMVDDGFW